MRSRVKGVVVCALAIALVAGLGAAWGLRSNELSASAAAEARAYNRNVEAPVLSRNAGLPIVTVVGDNMSEVAQSARPTKEWPLIVGSELDLHIISLSTSSSGYTSKPVSWTYGGTFVARAPHVEPSSRAVVFFGGANDSGVRASRVYDSALVSVRDAKKAAPQATVVIVGPVHASTGVSPALLSVRDTLKRAATAADVQFVDPIAARWVDGKRGVFRKDGISLTEAGQELIAARMRTVLAGAAE